jgi:ABC-type transporter Mla subunit MlaD
MSAAALIAKGAELLSKIPPSTLGSVIETIQAIVNGEPTKAERLAANAARALAAKAAAKARIKAK